MDALTEPDRPLHHVQLTGNKSLHVTAGCATTSLYRRKPASSSTNPTELPVDSFNPVPKRLIPDGVAHEDQRGPVAEGMYECVWNGRADYLVNGVERDWSVSVSDQVVVAGSVPSRKADAGSSPLWTSVQGRRAQLGWTCHHGQSRQKA